MCIEAYQLAAEASTFSWEEAAIFAVIVVGLGGLWQWVRQLRASGPLPAWPAERLGLVHVLIVAYVFVLLVAALGAWLGPIDSSPRGRLVGILLDGTAKVGVSALMLGGAAFLFPGGLRQFGVNLGMGGQTLRLALVTFLAGIGTAYGVGLLLRVLVVEATRVLYGTEPEFPTHALLEVYAAYSSPLVRGGLIVMAVGLAPLAEELFFRGYLQRALTRALGGPWRAILLTSLLFAAVHIPQWQDMLPLFLFSVGLGYAFARTRSLLCPLLAHMLFNAVPFLLLAFGL